MLATSSGSISPKFYCMSFWVLLLPLWVDRRESLFLELKVGSAYRGRELGLFSWFLVLLPCRLPAFGWKVHSYLFLSYSTSSVVRSCLCFLRSSYYLTDRFMVSVSHCSPVARLWVLLPSFPGRIFGLKVHSLSFWAWASAFSRSLWFLMVK